MEFLGDAILSSIVSESLFLLSPDQEEGELSLKRDAIISRSNLNKIAKRNFQDVLFHYKTKFISENMYGNFLEAIIGAVYLDKGLNIVEKVILKLWNSHIEKSSITQIDAKTKLQELALKKFKKLPIYKIISNTGPRHKPIFQVGVKLPNTKFHVSSGKSKKDAEQNAAIECLKNLNL